MRDAQKHAVTQKGYERLLKKREALEKQIYLMGQQAGDAAGANCDWHDNPAYDDAIIQIRMLSFQKSQLDEMLSNIEILADSGESGVVKVGTRVVLKIDGEQEEYLVGGLNEGNPCAGIISYNSPLGAAIVGHTVGETVTVEAPSGKFKAKIVSVLKVE